MKILILGGTRFLGRHLMDAALANGHEVTLFHRGRVGKAQFPQVEHLIGDRDGRLDALKGRQWDAVVDTCGFFPRIVRQSGELLKHVVNHYTFLSSCSVYADDQPPVIREEASLATIPPEQLEEVLNREEPGEYYGALKALCEQTLEEIMPGRVLHVRAGLIVGPHDYTDRFTYWPQRVACGGEVLAPNPKFPGVTLIDARDLAAWIIRMIEANKTGVYNAVGDVYSLPQLIVECKHVTASDATFTWVSDEFLNEQQVGMWMELPLWMPGTEEPFRFFRMSSEKAVADRLTYRPLRDTIRDTWQWDLTREAVVKRKAGLDPQREAELLQIWHQSR